MKKNQLIENKNKEKEVKSQHRKKNKTVEFFLVSKDFMRLRPTLPKNKKRNDYIFQNAFYHFLQITPDTFKETVLDDQCQKHLLGTKEKAYQEKKIPLGWYRMIKNW